MHAIDHERGLKVLRAPGGAIASAKLFRPPLLQMDASLWDTLPLDVQELILDKKYELESEAEFQAEMVDLWYNYPEYYMNYSFEEEEEVDLFELIGISRWP